MALRNVVTRGYGAGATIPFVVTRGYILAVTKVVVRFLAEDRNRRIIAEQRQQHYIAEGRERRIIVGQRRRRLLAEERIRRINVYKPN